MTNTSLRALLIFSLLAPGPAASAEFTAAIRRDKAAAARVEGRAPMAIAPQQGETFRGFAVQPPLYAAQARGVEAGQFRRALWGALLGLIGGVSVGFLIGGPAGAVVGGLTGILGGAWTHSRQL